MRFQHVLRAVVICALVALAAVIDSTPPSAMAAGSSPDTSGDVGRWSSIALDGSGNPVVSYYDDTNGDLKVLHCNDQFCSGGDESITAPDTTGNVGQWTSLALDSSGNPVVSYWDLSNSDLKLLHCNDPNCSGGDESITSPDTVSAVGSNTSLVLDGSGNPVVSYYFIGGGNLKLLHCNDPNCSGGDESITSPDTPDNVGQNTSLTLDGSGNPVVSYFDSTAFNVKVLHCNDPNCNGGDESITSPDAGGFLGTSLALDGSGNPVVSYYDDVNDDVKVLHCNDVNCSGGDESITAPDTGGDVGAWSSLALDGSGNPVVSYHDGIPNFDLKVLHCNDVNCSGGDESITSADMDGIAGTHTSLTLDAIGRPVISYVGGSFDLKVLHCFDADCAAAVGGIAEFAEPDGPQLAARDDSGTAAGVLAGVVAGVVAGAVALGGAAWYVRRRA